MNIIFYSAHLRRPSVYSRDNATSFKRGNSAQNILKIIFSLPATEAFYNPVS